MSFLKKNIFHNFGLFGAILVIAFTSFVWFPQSVSAANLGSPCIGASTNRNGVCYSPITSSPKCNVADVEVASNGACGTGADVDTCCVSGPPISLCASPNSCVDGTACPTGRNSAVGGCGINSGQVCCTPAPTTPPSASCTGTCRPLSPGCSSAETSSGGTCSSGICCVSNAATVGTPTSITFDNPLKFNTVEEVLGSLLGALRGIIVVLALIAIVIGAILYITSTGNDSRMTLAKGAITAAMIGLAIGIAAPSFLLQIGDILGWGPVVNSLPPETRTLTAIALSVLQFLLSIVGVLAIIMLVVGGIMYMTAAGNEDRIDTGKKIVTYSIVGIAVALAALVIVTQIAVLFA